MLLLRASLLLLCWSTTVSAFIEGKCLVTYVYDFDHTTEEYRDYDDLTGGCRTDMGFFVEEEALCDDGFAQVNCKTPSDKCALEQYSSNDTRIYLIDRDGPLPPCPVCYDSTGPHTDSCPSRSLKLQVCSFQIDCCTLTQSYPDGSEFPLPLQRGQHVKDQPCEFGAYTADEGDVQCQNGEEISATCGCPLSSDYVSCKGHCYRLVPGARTADEAQSACLNVHLMPAVLPRRHIRCFTNQSVVTKYKVIWLGYHLTKEGNVLGANGVSYSLKTAKKSKTPRRPSPLLALFKVKRIRKIRIKISRSSTSASLCQVWPQDDYENFVTQLGDKEHWWDR